MSGATQNEPVMDGALDDMSDGGTPKTEASDLMEDAHVDELEVEQAESQEARLDRGLDEAPVERGEVKG